MTHSLKQEAVSLTFHPYKPWLAVATITHLVSSSDSSVTSIKIWDVTPGLRRAVEGDVQALSASGEKAGYRCVGEITCAGTVSKIQFAPDGRLLGIANNVTVNQLSASKLDSSKQSDRVILYLASEGFHAVKTDIFEPFGKRAVHRKRITSLAFCPDPYPSDAQRKSGKTEEMEIEEKASGAYEQCQLLATGDADGVLRLWDFYHDETWQIQHNNGVQEIAFSPDGRLLLCLLRSGTVEGYTIDHTQDFYSQQKHKRREARLRERSKEFIEGAKHTSQIQKREGETPMKLQRTRSVLHNLTAPRRPLLPLVRAQSMKSESKRPKLLKFVSWQGLGDLLCLCFMPVTPPSTCLHVLTAQEVLQEALLSTEIVREEDDASPVIRLVGGKTDDLTPAPLIGRAQTSGSEEATRGSIIHLRQASSPPPILLQRALSQFQLFDGLPGKEETMSFFRPTPKPAARQFARTEPPTSSLGMVVPRISSNLGQAFPRVSSKAYSAIEIPESMSFFDHKHALRGIKPDRLITSETTMEFPLSPMIIPKKETGPKERLIMEASKKHLWSWGAEDTLQDPDIIWETDLPVDSDDESGGVYDDDDDESKTSMKGKRRYQIAVGGKGRLRVFQFEFDEEKFRRTDGQHKKSPSIGESPKDGLLSPDTKFQLDSERDEKEIGCWVEFGAFECSFTIDCVGSYWDSPALVFGETEITASGAFHRLRMWSPLAPSAPIIVGLHSERITALDLPKPAMIKSLQPRVISSAESFFASTSMDSTFRLWIRSESKHINQDNKKKHTHREKSTDKSADDTDAPLPLHKPTEPQETSAEESEEEEAEKSDAEEVIDYSDQNHLEDFGKLARSAGRQRDCECTIL